MNIMDIQSEKAVLETTQSFKDVLRDLRHEGYFAVLVDRAPVFNKETLLHALYQSCMFPGYFGFNWDALKDILLDASWTSQNGQEFKGLVLVFRNMNTLEKRDAGVAETFLSIAKEVAEHRQQKALAPLRVILVRDNKAA